MWLEVYFQMSYTFFFTIIALHFISQLFNVIEYTAFQIQLLDVPFSQFSIMLKNSYDFSLSVSHAIYPSMYKCICKRFYIQIFKQLKCHIVSFTLECVLQSIQGTSFVLFVFLFLFFCFFVAERFFNISLLTDRSSHYELNI